MTRLFLTLILLASSFAALMAEESVNLLKNTDFSAAGDKGPEGWTLDKQDTSNTLTVDTTDKPEGAKASLKVEIKLEKGEYDGSIYQWVTGLKPDATYIVSGWIKSDVPDAAYIGVKFFKEKAETKRGSTAKSTTGWQFFSRELPAAGAEKASFCLRFLYKPEYVGKTIRFANLSLTEKK